MNRRKADLVMIDLGIIPRDGVRCTSPATATPCEFDAVIQVQLPNLHGEKTFDLCVRCERAYYEIGYRYRARPMPANLSIPSQPHDDRKLSDELDTMNEYTRRERQGY